MINKDLIEITTARQAKNGTRAWKCSRTGALYGSYDSGSVRRTPLDFQFGYKVQTRLNSTHKVELQNGWTQTQFISIPREEDRIALIDRRSASYKGFWNNTK